jgi:hypothetical protein
MANTSGSHCERFLFKGGAVGFGGSIRKPRIVHLPAEASVLLPVGGGVVSSASGGISLTAPGQNARNSPFVISFREARTEVRGEYVGTGLKTKTTVSAEIHDLRVLSQDPGPTGPSRPRRRHEVTIKKISVTMESRHDGKRGEQTRIKVIRPTLDGLEIDGRTPVKATFAGTLMAKATYDDMKNAYEKNATFRNRHDKLFKKGKKRRGPTDFPAIPRDRGFAYCTIVHKLTGLPKAPKADEPRLRVDQSGNSIPNEIHLPGFGIIALGEFAVFEHERRLTMVRFQLGSPTEGVTSFGDLIIDGSGWPP